jgi:bifunctional UDP-N-acetylglucosamine pyrophosphorylase/glucosamine-1-phosphate N-acetyltransferase
MPKTTTGIILAAGKGTRMKSDLPKVLHTLDGKPMLSWVTDALRASGVSQLCLVLSEDLDGFHEFLSAQPDTLVAIQKNRLGTGDAVAAAAYAFKQVQVPKFTAGRLHQGDQVQSDAVLICAGDIPAIRSQALKEFIEASEQAGAKLSVLGMDVPDPKGYGRLVVEEGNILKSIVEEKDADEATRAITLCNTGVIYGDTSVVFELLGDLKPNNAQGEYYLTDCFELARARDIPTYVHVAADYREFAGVNDREQLTNLERWLKNREIEE